MMDSLVEDAVSETEESDELENSSPATGGSFEDNDKGMTKDEIGEIADSLSTKVSVVGCGGGGCNTINRIAEEGIDGAELIALNTDVQDLKQSNADTIQLIGRDACGGRGAGSVPLKGEEAARESIDEVEGLVSDSDMVFITAGLGGGTGTGAAPVVAEVAGEHALTIAIVTTPFSAEGQARRDNADAGLENLRKHADTVIVVPNDRLLDFAPSLPLKKAFKLCDEVLMRSVKGITELITQPNLVNLDFSDIRTTMEGGGVAMIGLGQSDTSDKAQESVTEALQSPLLDVNIGNASNVLVNVTGPPTMETEEAQGVVEQLNRRVADESRIIWGAGVDEDLDETLRTMIVITGVESPQIYGDDAVTTQETADPEGLEDLDYVE